MATTSESEADPLVAAPWHAGITRQHWLVLLLASAGWVFDVYEGQVFNITAVDLIREVAPGRSVQGLRDLANAVFLAGGALGGVACGVLADRHGRKPVLIWTILVYSLFSGLTGLAGSWWQVLALRFLVAVGVAGAWAVAAALVAEVFPKRVRAYASSLFHATSVLGTWLAALVGMAVGTHWRYAYLAGLLPALLAVLIRTGISEPPGQVEEMASGDGRPARARGSLAELLGDPAWRWRALGGLVLAAVGLGTFWGVTVAGQALALDFLVRHGADSAEAAERAKFAYGIVETAGGGLGLLAFGPLCSYLGRRWAFITAHLAAYAIVPITCYLPTSYLQLLLLLPAFGFLTLGIHAGYSVYFPELFPQHLRATGTGFCFNGGRLLAATVLFGSGRLKDLPGMDLRLALFVLGHLFLLGAVCAYFMPETRNADLAR